MKTKKESPKINKKVERLDNKEKEKVVRVNTLKSDDQNFNSFLLEHYRQSTCTHIC